jgi:hypothetical protein
MASEISDYLALQICEWIAGITMPAAPTTVYVALHTGDCGVNGTGGTDVTTTVRVAGRVAVTWDTASARHVLNSADVDFGLAAGPCVIDSASLWDASSAGNCMGASLLPSSQAVTAGLPVKIPTGSLDFGFTVSP